MNLWQKEKNDLALLDEEFLSALTEQKERELYARIDSLDINDLPIESIEGKVTGGSVNVDGSSAVRRSCSLTMIAENVNLHDYYWGLRTKFKLAVGVKNKIADSRYTANNSSYPDIVWFPLGVFLIASFNTSLSTNSYTISISGKDKMCMLNGELGGSLFASIDFGKEEELKKIFIKALVDNPISSDLLMNNTYYYKNNDEYIKILTPSQLFVETSNTYSPSTYYYEKTTKYYVLDRSTTATFGRTYYALKDLYIESEEYSITQIPLEKIIKESVHAYAKEPYYNIIINDLSDYGLEKLTYVGDIDLYALRKDNEITQLIVLNSNESFRTMIANNFIFDNLNALLEEDAPTPTHFSINNGIYSKNNQGEYTVVKFSYGDDLGYRITDLVYNGDLISSIGESLTSMLDKIKLMLGDFEYFYDLEGHFVFLRKKIYVNTSWSLINNPLDEEETYIDVNTSKFSFNFEGNRLITAIQNTPVLNNVKNDFIVWGKRKGILDEDIPIHARYVIDVKPTEYLTLNNVFYYTKDAIHNKSSLYDNLSATGKLVDWRELIYQMALDYYNKDWNNDNFLINVAAKNPDKFPTGYTGYELYYADLQGFWRLLYNPDYLPAITYTPGHYEETVEASGIYYVKNLTWYDETPESIDLKYCVLETQISDISLVPEGLRKYVISTNATDKTPLYWNIDVFENPESLNFWIEFLDDGELLQEFGVSQIGDRTKVVNDDKVSAIIFRETPGFLFINKVNNNATASIELILNSIEREFTGYICISIPSDFALLFMISSKYLSAKDKIDELIYLYAYCAENISITALPVYHLQPNTRIYVCDTSTNIIGEYIVNKITIPLTYNGTMSINATLAPERIY